MKWITQIILKDVKIGKASEFILKDFHPDAPVRKHLFTLPSQP